MQRDCNNTFCKMCCDLGPDILKTTANNSIVAKDLGLQAEPGSNIIDKLITFDEIEMCRNNCQVEYPMTEPKNKQKAQSIPNLGFDSLPGRSCQDIKMNMQGKAKDGIQWIEVPEDDEGNSVKLKVFCDMSTSGGGWMLVLNYVHLPGQRTVIKQLSEMDDAKAVNEKSLMPTTINANSHVNLKMLGLTNENDAWEVKFVCAGARKNVEKNPALSEVKFFSSFTVTGDPGVINTLVTGQQDGNLSPSAFTGANSEGMESIPEELKKHPLVDGLSDQDKNDFIPRQVNKCGTKAKGGYFDRPFGVDGHAWWSINDSAKYQECGYEATDNDAGLYSTIHQIYVRPNTEPQDDDSKSITHALLSTDAARKRAKKFWDSKK